jgi:hypothetical protein
MEKESIINFNGIRGNKHQFYLNGSEKPNSKFYFNFLLPQQIEMIRKQFEIFYNKLLHYSLDGEEKDLLTKYKGGFEAVFYGHVQKILFLYIKKGEETNKNKLLIPDAIINIVINEIFFWADLSILVLMDHPANLKVLYKYFVETTDELMKKNFKLSLYGNLDISDPAEQELFRAVWKINDNCNKENIKFSPFATFKQLNDQYNYVNSNLIDKEKFTEKSPLYNRYKQFRKNEQKKNNK